MDKDKEIRHAKIDGLIASLFICVYLGLSLFAMSMLPRLYGTLFLLDASLATVCLTASIHLIFGKIVKSKKKIEELKSA